MAEHGHENAFEMTFSHFDLQTDAKYTEYHWRFMLIEDDNKFFLIIHVNC